MAYINGNKVITNVLYTGTGDAPADALKAIVECNHSYEITGNTGDEHGLAIKDQQMLIKKIQGQTLLVNGIFKHSKNNLISTGRNLWDEKWELGYINDNGVLEENNLVVRSKNYIKILGGIQYYFRKNAENYINGIKILYYDKSFNFLSVENFYGNNNFTTPKNCYYIKFATYATVTTYGNDICINVSDISFNGTYEPYKEEVIIVNEELKAFDFIKGNQLVKASGEVDLGSLAWSYINDTNGKRFTTDALKELIKTPTTNSINGNCICSKYATATYADIYYNRNDKSIGINTNGTIAIYDSSYTDATAFKQSLSGVKLVYELATPVITDITLPSGMAVYNNGLQIQDGDIPYILTKEYALNANAQILANIEIDREQQKQINNLMQSGTGSIGGAEYLITPPAGDNNNGLKFVVLDSSVYPHESVTQYNGYLYMWY